MLNDVPTYLPYRTFSSDSCNLLVLLDLQSYTMFFLNLNVGQYSYDTLGLLDIYSHLYSGIPVHLKIVKCNSIVILICLCTVSLGSMPYMHSVQNSTRIPITQYGSPASWMLDNYYISHNLWERGRDIHPTHYTN